MKKIFTFVVALFALAIGANAETTTVGATDNTAGWWTAFSDYYSLTGDGTITLKFKNYTSGTNLWNNWVCVVTNNNDRNTTDYSEYFVMRADNYGWGTDWKTTENCPGVLAASTWEDADFKANMNGADVVLTITRIGNNLSMHAHSTNGTTTYFEDYQQTVENLPETIRCFLTVDGSHITDLSGTVSTGNAILGSTNNDCAWLSAFSGPSSLTGNGTITYTFTNYTDKVNTWDNWVLVCTNDNNRGATGYSEYFVMRADNYGWGSSWNTSESNPGTLESNFNWDTFANDLYGAKMVVVLTRKDNQLTMRADYTTTSNATYYEEFSMSVTDLPETIRTFLTAQAAHLENVTVKVAKDATAISSVKAASEEADGAIYNLAGQRVSKDTKGLVIKNGKKMVVK